MTTEAQILANRLNAQKSTGPCSCEGKAAAKAKGKTWGGSAKGTLYKTTPEQVRQIVKMKEAGCQTIIFGVEKQWAKRFDGFSYQQQSWYYPAAVYSGSGGAPASFNEFSSSFSSFASSISNTFSSSPSGSGAGGAAGGGGGGGGGGAG